MAFNSQRKSLTVLISIAGSTPDSSASIVNSTSSKESRTLERRLDAGLPEEDRGVFAVFVEVSVEYALIHHVTLAVDLENDPSQVMRLEDGKCIGSVCDGLLDDLGVVADDPFFSGDDLRDDGKAVARRRFREDRAVAALFGLARE